MGLLHAFNTGIQKYTLDLEGRDHSAEELFLAGVVEVEEVRVEPRFVANFSPRFLGSGSGTDHVLAFAKDLDRLVRIQLDLGWTLLITPEQNQQTDSGLVSHFLLAEQSLSRD